MTSHGSGSASAGVIPPGATIGILGGGQLGRMLAMAAAQLGYRCHIYDPDPVAPAADVAHAATCATWDDTQALAAFASRLDVCTLEFENVPVATVDQLAALCPVRPGARVLATAQDRVLEKQFVQALGGDTAPFAAVDDLAALEDAIARIGCPAILKTRRLGYDGKGQARLRTPADAAAAWAALGGQPAILEGFVAFDSEASVLVARGLDGACVHYGPVANRHDDGILSESRAPAGLDAAIAARAVALARHLAERLDHVGVMAAELFIAGDRVLFNELAPRVHNSGHWTIEGAVTSQFENHIRAICGLPLGATDLRGAVRMRNLIGEQAMEWPMLLADPAARLHLYGKQAARPGRKMGHVTWVTPDT